MKNLLELAQISIEEKRNHFASLLEKRDSKPNDVLFSIHTLRMRCIWMVYFPGGNIEEMNNKVKMPSVNGTEGMNSEELDFFRRYLEAERTFREIVNLGEVITNSAVYDRIEPEFHHYRYERWKSNQETGGWKLVETKRKKRFRKFSKKMLSQNKDE